VCFTFDLADVGVQTPKVFTDRVANAEARFRCSKSSKNRDKKAGISMRDEKVLLIKRKTLKNFAIEEQFAAARRLTYHLARALIRSFSTLASASLAAISRHSDARTSVNKFTHLREDLRQ
jgi:hypothetical protein